MKGRWAFEASFVFSIDFNNIQRWPDICNDKSDAESLYQLLEDKVIPVFYNDSKKWTQIMRSSIQTATEFTAHRMVGEYKEKYYQNQKQEIMSTSK